jgi:hypothetical protein
MNEITKSQYATLRLGKIPETLHLLCVEHPLDERRGTSLCGVYRNRGVLQRADRRGLHRIL